MRKIIIFVLCYVFILAGCTPKDRPQIKDSIPSEDSIEVKGCYYKGIDERNIERMYSPLASYQYFLLHYNRHMYTSSYQYTSENKSDINMDAIVGDKITSVYGNHDVYWSTDSDKLLETTLEGTLYTVKGYDEDFRICLYFEKIMPSQDTLYCLYIFDQLNDITLSNGEELYKDKLHLDESVLAYYNTDTSEISNTDTLSQLSMTDRDLQEFITELFKSEFIDNRDMTYPKLDSLVEYPIIFVDSIGLTTKIAIYKDGYVKMENSEKTVFLVKVDNEICLKMIDKIQQYK